MVLFVQIAPVYLSSCMKHGMGLLEILLYKQPVQHKELLLKVIGLERLFAIFESAFAYYCFVWVVITIVTICHSCFFLVKQNLEICRLYDLDDCSSNIMKVLQYCVYFLP